MSNTVLECRDFHHLNASSVKEICNFIKAANVCWIEDGYIDYTRITYCSFTAALFALAITVWVVWLIFLFVALASCADNFFCPCLSVMAKTLRMSDNIAISWVTLLAFGNGAPDVFAATAAITSAKNGDMGMAFGALLGAGVFVTTFVVGSISFVGPFDLMQRPFLRDIIFFILAVVFSFAVLYNEVFTLAEAASYIGIYGLYVVVVIVGRILYQRRKRRSLMAQASIQSDSDYYGPLPVPAEANDYRNHGPQAEFTDGTGYNGNAVADENDNNGELPNDPTRSEVQVNTDSELTHLLMGTYASRAKTPMSQLLAAVSPVELDSWAYSRCYGKVYSIFKAPALFILKLTIPVVDHSVEKHKWNRHLNAIHCMTSPVFIIFGAKSDVALYYLGGKFPVWALVLLIGFILALIVLFTSRGSQPPKYHWVFAYLGFAVAVIWIKIIATEVVNLLKTFGTVFDISDTILGLTFLAWGNSIGDFIADVAMARRGSPRVGISACFGGPLFNILIGIGIPFTIVCIEQGGEVALQFTLIQIVLVASLLWSLVSSLTVVPFVLKFHMNRIYGIYLVLVYCSFLLVAILVETNVIHIAV